MVIIVIAAIAGSLYALQKYLYHRYWQKGVEVGLMFDQDAVTAGEYVNLLEVIENRKYLPLPSLKVKFQCSRHLYFMDDTNSAVTDRYYRNDLFAVMPYKRITRSNRLFCPQRGYYTIQGVDLVGADLFFSGEMVASRDIKAALYVYPAPAKVQDLDEALKRVNGEIAVKRYELEDPFTFRGIREYEVHDDMKSVNWKATAKTGDLKVNIKAHTAVKNVRIFMNLSDRNILRREELLELGISICKMMAENLLSQGIKLSVYANAKDCISNQILQIENRGTHVALSDIDKSLARLDLQNSPADFTQSFREKLFEEEDLYTIFISPERHDEFQDLLCAYQEKASFIWLCPVKEMEPESIKEELAQKTLLLLHEKNKVLG